MTLTQKNEMASWLRESEWTWFCTLTFRKSLSSTTCHKIFFEWIQTVEKSEAKPIRWVRMVERGKSTGRRHIHALIAGPRRMTAEAAAQAWRTMAGNATIGDYDPERRGVEYMLKTKEDNTEHDLDFSAPEQRPPSAESKNGKGSQPTAAHRNNEINDGAGLRHFTPQSLEESPKLLGSSASVGFEPLLSAREAASLLRLHPVTLLRWAREGRVPHHRMSRKVFFRVAELEAWCAEGFNMTHTVRAAQLRKGARV